MIVNCYSVLTMIYSDFFEGTNPKATKIAVIPTIIPEITTGDICFAILPNTIPTVTKSASIKLQVGMSVIVHLQKLQLKLLFYRQ